jgi:hypothetical protein
MRHSKLAVPSGLENPNDGEALFVGPDGPDTIAVSGAVKSTDHVNDAGEPSTFPAGSFARTSNVCAPSANEESARGDEHADHAPASSRHSNDAVPSVLENASDAAALFDGLAGVLVNDVGGAVTSTVNARCAGEPSTFPAGSFARTSNVCAPSANDAYAFGLAHAPHAPPSMRHSKLAVPSVLENSSTAEVLLVGSAGPLVSVVGGAVTSTVNARCAGEPSTFPAGSFARTSNV